jgi:hypothetical protein
MIFMGWFFSKKKLGRFSRRSINKRRERIQATLRDLAPDSCPDFQPLHPGFGAVNLYCDGQSVEKVDLKNDLLTRFDVEILAEDFPKQVFTVEIIAPFSTNVWMVTPDKKWIHVHTSEGIV